MIGSRCRENVDGRAPATGVSSTSRSSFTDDGVDDEYVNDDDLQ